MKWFLTALLSVVLAGCLIPESTSDSDVPYGRDVTTPGNTVGRIAAPHPGQRCNDLCTHHFWIEWYDSGHRHQEGMCGHKYDEKEGYWTLPYR